MGSSKRIKHCVPKGLLFVEKKVQMIPTNLIIIRYEFLIKMYSIYIIFSMINSLFRTQFLNSVMHRRDGSTRRKFFE